MHGLFIKERASAWMPFEIVIEDSLIMRSSCRCGFGWIDSHVSPSISMCCSYCLYYISIYIYIRVPKINVKYSPAWAAIYALSFLCNKANGRVIVVEFYETSSVDLILF